MQSVDLGRDGEGGNDRRAKHDVDVPPHPVAPGLVLLPGQDFDLALRLSEQRSAQNGAVCGHSLDVV